jgi:hypothetical protein
VAKRPQLGRGPHRPGEKSRNHDGEDHKLIRPGPSINPIEQQVHAIHDRSPNPIPCKGLHGAGAESIPPNWGAGWRQLGWAAAGGGYHPYRQPTPRSDLGLTRGAITKKFVRSLSKMWQGGLGRHIAQCSHPWARQSSKGAVATRRPWLFGRTPNRRDVPEEVFAGLAAWLGKGVCPPRSRQRCSLTLAHASAHQTEPSPARAGPLADARSDRKTCRRNSPSPATKTLCAGTGGPRAPPRA